MNGEAQEKELDSRVIPIVASAKTLTIRNSDTYAQAGDLLLAIKTARNEVAQAFDSSIADAHALHKKLLATKAKYDLPLIQAEGRLKACMSEYIEEQEAKRREEEAKLQLIANQQAESRKVNEAAALESAGLIAEAEEVLNEPIHAPVLLPPMTPKIAGIASREIWRYRVTDVRLIPREYLVPDNRKIGGVVRALKDLANIPGVEAYCEKVMSARAGSE